jgi:predicted amidohydrolase YtcJ
MATSPTLILHNGKIFNPHDIHHPLQAIVIAGDEILSLSADSNIQGHITGQTEVIDLAGRSVLPGLIDAHIHLEKYASAVSQINCETGTLDECLRRVAETAGKTPPGTWIQGHGWNQNAWGRYGTRQELDAAAPHHPVYLTAKSLHAAWANSCAIEAAGLREDTPSPPDGELVRDGLGNLTGILFEGAMPLISSQIPSPTTDELRQKLVSAQDKLNRLGITGVHDFDGPRCFSALQRLHKEGQLTLRVLKNIPLEYLDHAIELGIQTGFGNDWLRIGNIKIFSDGALGPRTAAMISPYTGEPDNTGILLKDREELLDIGLKAAQAGLGLTIHAIGDKANHEALAALKGVRRWEHDNRKERLPHRIEHLQLLHPDDLNLPGELRIIASMQPIHATSDMEMANVYWGNRTRYAYAWRSQLDSGAVLYFGSDAPVESPNPFSGIHAAVTRQPVGAPSPGRGWIPEERISLVEAINAYSANPGIAFRSGTLIGELRPGFKADLIILNEDLFDLPGTDLYRVLPSGTIIAGKWVFRDF